MIQLTGHNFTGNKTSNQGDNTFQAIDPATNQQMEPYFYEATQAEIDEAIKMAEAAFPIYSEKSGTEKATFLEAIADEIMALGDPMVERCCQETALPEGRITGERGRTVNQLRLFASLLREGSWVDARIDTADPDRQPAPKPDVRSMQKALGPVGIFGASNFPLAFSVAGGDTASALAAGCSIVVKAHPAHPGTCEMIAMAIQEAIQKCDMPDGTFSMVHGVSNEVGQAIVQHPLIKAIGFTGSFKGGKALFDTAAKRPEPIPVYAEMGSTNPVFILPGALKEKSEEVAKGLYASVTLGAGQFCTNPGVVVHESSDDGTRFHNSVSELFQRHESQPMLTASIHKAYQAGVENLNGQNNIQLMAEGQGSDVENRGKPYFFRVDAQHFLADSALEEEVFGPSTLAVTTSKKEEMMEVARHMHGHLTATLYGTEEDLVNYQELIAILQRKVGRLIFNGFPTGVEVCHSIIHGGPFPATTDSRTTSVGTAAITRFTRPVCYQNFPQSMLPDELKDNNPLDVMRLENGERKR